MEQLIKDRFNLIKGAKLYHMPLLPTLVIVYV